MIHFQESEKSDRKVDTLSGRPPRASDGRPVSNARKARDAVNDFVTRVSYTSINPASSPMTTLLIYIFVFHLSWSKSVGISIFARYN